MCKVQVACTVLCVENFDIIGFNLVVCQTDTDVCLQYGNEEGRKITQSCEKFNIRIRIDYIYATDNFTFLKNIIRENKIESVAVTHFYL